MREHKISQRRVCDLVGVDPKTVRRERPPDHADIRKKMHEIAGTRRRFGYRRVGILLEREGFTMNEKKLYRLYKEEGLSVRRRRGRKRARGTRVPMPIPNRPNVRWSLDPRHGHSDQWRIHGSISDTFGVSRKFRILAVIDDCTRENLTLIADTSLSGARVARELTALIRIYGKPGCIVSDRRRSENDPGDRFPEEGHRVHQHGDPQMGGRYRRGLALHRPWKATAERADRKLQRQPQG